MPRHARRHADSGVYHVTARGNDRHLVFLDVPDRQVFIAKLAEARDRYGWECLSYCLMGNHYHLLVVAGPEALAAGMRMLNGTYAAHFNRRHQRIGHLWQERYASEAVQRDRHLLATMRYIALNPVEAGWCERPDDWVWSAHRGLMGRRRDIVGVNAALRFLHPDTPVARRLYAELVGAAPHGPTPGSDEVPSIWRPTIPEILGRNTRDMGVAVANVDYAYSLREIADVTGAHHTTVRRWLGHGRVELAGRATGTVPVAQRGLSLLRG
jgi:putative transposase